MLPRISLRSIRATKKKEKEAERRKTLFRNLRSLAGCGTRPVKGAHAFRRSTAALARGTHASQRLSFGPGFTGQAPKAAGFTPPVPVSLAASTSHAGHSAGRLMPEPPESKGDEPSPAGTALAPPTAVTRPASFT